MKLPSNYVLMKTAKVTLIAAFISISLSTGIRVIVGAQADTITILVRLVLPFVIAIPIGLIWFTRLEKLERTYRALVKHANELARTASTDPLTGLLNRRAFIKQFEGALEIGVKGWFLLADVDYLKAINDHYGHLSGDEAVMAVAEALQQVLPDDSLIGRIGGDEFCAFIDVASMNHTHEIAAKINQEAAQIFSERLPEAKQRLSVSIGISKSERIMSFKDMMAQVDEKLYRKKRAR